MNGWELKLTGKVSFVSFSINETLKACNDFSLLEEIRANLPLFVSRATIRPGFARPIVARYVKKYQNKPLVDLMNLIAYWWNDQHPQALNFEPGDLASVSLFVKRCIEIGIVIKLG